MLLCNLRRQKDSGLLVLVSDLQAHKSACFSYQQLVDIERYTDSSQFTERFP